MFVKARPTPTTASESTIVFVVSDITIKAAINETEEIAFVKDINGVWSRRETWLIRPMPRNVDMTNISKLTGRSVKI